MLRWGGEGVEVGWFADMVMVGAKVHESVQYLAYTVISMSLTPTYNAERLAPSPCCMWTVINTHSCTPFNKRNLK